MKTATQAHLCHGYPVQGVWGLGLRNALIDQLQAVPSQVDFGRGRTGELDQGRRCSAKAMRRLTERYPLVRHGLSLSIGGPAPSMTVFFVNSRRFSTPIRARLHRTPFVLR